MPEVLYEEVLEVDERVVLYRGEPGAGSPVKGAHGTDSPCEVLGVGRSEQLLTRGGGDGLFSGRTGDLLEIQQPVDLGALRGKLEGLLCRGIHSLAVVLMHSYT